MNLKWAADALSATALYAPDGWEQRVAGGVFVSDLISDILVSETDQPLLLTSLLSDQVLRTAEVIGATAVVLANRRHVPDTIAQAARRIGMPLFHTPYAKFEACLRLGPLAGESR